MAHSRAVAVYKQRVGVASGNFGGIGFSHL